MILRVGAMVPFVSTSMKISSGLQARKQRHEQLLVKERLTPGQDEVLATEGVTFLYRLDGHRL